MHILCTICSDLVNQAENIHVTKCGHVFHYHCLSQWIGRSKTCPQCRCKVTDRCMFRLYPTISNEGTADDAATLQSRLDDTGLQLRQQRAACKERDDKLDKLTADIKKNEELIKSYEKKLVNRDSAIAAMKDQMLYLKVQSQETGKLKEENEELKKNIQTLNGLQKVLNATSSEVETMLQGYTDLKTIATFATALKRALCESENKKNETRDRLNNAKHALGLEKSKVAELQKKLSNAEEDLSNLQGRYEYVKSKRKSSDLRDMAESPPKRRRRSESCDLNTAILNDSSGSVNSMARHIEKSDSPYLSLMQSNLALAVLQRRTESAPMGTTMKPSEYAILNAARNITRRKPSETSNTSIFHKKQPLQADPSDRPSSVNLDLSYDGLGGHSKLDTFPVPLKTKSLVPKLTAKHRLKRPTPPASQDIGKLLERMTSVKQPLDG